MEHNIQQYLYNLPEGKKFLAMQLRDIILIADSRISESIKWNQLTFSMGKQNIAFIYSFPDKEYVNLGFFKATSLPDPKQLFEGTGAGMRHIKLYENKRIPTTQIRNWIKQAIMISAPPKK